MFNKQGVPGIFDTENLKDMSSTFEGLCLMPGHESIGKHEEY